MGKAPPSSPLTCDGGKSLRGVNGGGGRCQIRERASDTSGCGFFMALESPPPRPSSRASSPLPMLPACAKPSSLEENAAAPKLLSSPPLCRSQRQQCGGSLRENAEPCCRQQGRVPQRKTLCIVDAGGRGCRCREGAAVLHTFSKICASRRCSTLLRQRPSEGWSAIFLISRCCHRPFSRKCCVAEATFLLPVPSLQQRF